ncbi:hypothetical protein [Solicola sp. PLA-1-18]|uniref:hypothetical protein n=1 Tax=Solicola sp. PLA-1-18 TaxID=3380532 RepID=UPI003B826AC3
MAWTWQLETSDGTVVDPATLDDLGGADGVVFPSRGDAESWVGEVFSDLTAQGVDQVTLFEDGRSVYGPMSLHQQ